MHIIARGKDILSRIINSHDLSAKSGGILNLFKTVGFHTPLPDALGVALASRCTTVEKDAVTMLFRDGQLLCTPGPRATVRTILSHDWETFNPSLAPEGESELLGMLGGVRTLLVMLGKSPLYWHDLALSLLPEVLATARYSKGTLCKTLAERALERLPASVQEVWSWPSPQFSHQTLGESLMRYLLPVVTLTVPVLLTYDWRISGFTYGLSSQGGPGDALSLLIRYLHAYAPADSHSFARWAGISDEHAHRLWSRLGGTQLVSIGHEGAAGWMLASDLGSMQGLRPPEGLRLISPYDPLRQMPMRNLLVHGKKRFQYFFRSARSPGLVLSDGECVAGWLMRRKKNSWSLVIEDIGESLGRVAMEEFESEAQAISRAIGIPCDGISITPES